MSPSTSTQDETFSCLMVRRTPAEADEPNTGDLQETGHSASETKKKGTKKTECSVESIGLKDLPEGDVLIDVEWSSLNYKDALACQGHPGVVRSLPHIPGIDCAGIVRKSNSPEYQVGQQVLVTGYELGSGRWGGWSARVQVPSEWVVALPAGLTTKTAMRLGTAGFTAAQSVQALQHQGVIPESGEVVVTGATGGVGSLAVAILARLGYQVAAVTGKADQKKLLEQLGAARILTREEVDDSSSKPLLPTRWAGAVDTVGGNILSTLLRSTQYRGCVAACGLVAGDQLPLSIYPFILRGITFTGIDSAKCPRKSRESIWQRLANEWKPDNLEPLTEEISLKQIPEKVQDMLAGKTHGRILIRPE